MFEGYPKAPSRPVHKGTFSDYSYVNQTGIKLDNENIQKILTEQTLAGGALAHMQALREATCIIVRTSKLGSGILTEAIGTGTLINHEQVVTAKHCLEYIPDTGIYFVFGYFTRTGETHLFDIARVECHPDKDLALVTLEGNPGIRYTPIPIRYIEQAGGEYWIIHHAGGLPAQVSTGHIADLSGRYYQLQQEIIVHAGDGASGAGIFSSRFTDIIGIIYYRSMGFGRVSRKTILFGQVKDWILRNMSPENLLLRSMSVVMQQQYFRPRDALSIGKCFTIHIDTSRLEEESPEAITWSKLASKYIPEIKQFLRELNEHVNGSGAAPKIPAILSYGVDFDTHQPQHHINTKRRDDKDKTTFATEIGTNCQAKIIQALAVLIQFMQHLIFKRLNQEQRNTLLCNKPKILYPDIRSPGFTFAFRLGFNLALLREGEDPHTLLYMETGVEVGAFHFYPEIDYTMHTVDKKIRNKLDNAHIYDINKFLDKAVDASHFGF